MTTTPTMTTEVTPEMIVDGLKKVLALNQNDVDATLSSLKVAETDKAVAKSKLRGLLNNDPSVIAELSSLSTEPTTLKAASGGVTKFSVLKKWGIPYGDRLYISHSIMENVQDVGALVTAITAACGPEAAPLVVGLGIGLAALKLLDRGNGIMITQIPIAIGPCVPTPQ